jgi:hypothetical protein
MECWAYIKDASIFEVTLPPQIELTEADTWLKYRYSAAVKGSVSGSVAPVAFKLDASKRKNLYRFSHPFKKRERTRRGPV